MTYCITCARYDIMGFGHACPCTHKDGVCQTPQRRSRTSGSAIGAAPPLRFLNTITYGEPTMKGTIYAIIDTKADDIIGGLHIHRHEAAAVRMFTDVAAHTGTDINKHPEDYKLVALGNIKDDHTITGTARPLDIITGAQWLALTAANKEKQHNA